jgi:hypothetical protein
VSANRTPLNVANFRPIPVPPEVAVCPICNAPIVVEEISEWEPEDGIPTPSGFSIECTTEPDIDGEEWWAWHHGHWSMPYVDWMPLEGPVHDWLCKTYRVEFHP